jgi:hypothetical protein
MVLMIKIIGAPYAGYTAEKPLKPGLLSPEGDR